MYVRSCHLHVISNDSEEKLDTMTEALNEAYHLKFLIYNQINSWASTYDEHSLRNDS
jgi:hypothetical protein